MDPPLSGEHCKLPSGVWGKAPPANDFGAFWWHSNATDCTKNVLLQLHCDWKKWLVPCSVLYTNYVVVNCAHCTVSVVDSTIHNLNSTNETTSTTTPLYHSPKKISLELRETHGWPWWRLGCPDPWTPLQPATPLAVTSRSGYLASAIAG